MMFIPFYVQEFFNKAQIADTTGQVRPLVAADEKVVTTGSTAADHQSGGITPCKHPYYYL